MKTTEKLELLSPAALVPAERNPRKHTLRQMKALQRSLREFGFVAPVLIDRDGVIIAGHAMVEAAKAEGMTEIPCVRVEHLSAKQRKAYQIADNRLAEMSGWDETALSDCLQELFESGVDLLTTGFGEYKLPDALASALEPEQPESQEIENCKQGCLWQLGNHRLLCGDATDPQNIARLMDGKKASLLLTDPPYNVDYHGGAADHLVIQNDRMPAHRFQQFLTDAFTAAKSALKPGAVFYIWYASVHTLEFAGACKDAGLNIFQHLVWVKNHFMFTIRQQDYKYQHEPCLAGQVEYDGCLYGWDKRAPHRWFGGNAQSTVYQFDKPLKSEEHPTMKPVELFAQQIRNSTQKNDIILDPFCGSGTSILAAESYGRKCFAMELDPKYCAVIIRRWEKQFGQKAVLLEGGDHNGGNTSTA